VTTHRGQRIAACAGPVRLLGGSRGASGARAAPEALCGEGDEDGGRPGESCRSARAVPPRWLPSMTSSSGGESASVPGAGGARDAPGGLPRPRTSFVGRENELAEARALLDHNRLLTLTGPGGCGKTRLCIALAARVIGGFPDGVHFVPLAAIRDPS